MLVLTRKREQAIRIGDMVRIVVLQIEENQVKIGIQAPKGVKVHREEIFLKIRGNKDGKKSTAKT